MVPWFLPNKWCMELFEGVIMTASYTRYDDQKKNQKIKIRCNKCATDTAHRIVHNYQVNGEELFGYGDFIAWVDDYQILECNGCGEITFKHYEWFSEYEEPEDPGSGGKEYLYPPRKTDQVEIEIYENFPHKLSLIYGETINCFNGSLYLLCAAGLRALIEGLCSELGISDGPIIEDGVPVGRSKKLVGKINGLVERGHLTIKNADSLHELRFLGNNSMHDLDKPRRDHLVIAIKLIKHVLESIYNIPKLNESLKVHRESGGLSEIEGLF